MKEKNTAYIAALAVATLLLTSCAQEGPTGSGEDESGIAFVTSLPGVSTRSDHNSNKDKIDGGFYVSAICPEDETKIDESGNIGEYFAGQKVEKSVDGAFRSDQCRWPANKDNKDGRLKFFAFYPSREEMGQSAGVESGAGYFELENNSKKNGNTVAYDYRMTKFAVNKDIARHIDFVTATAEGTKSSNLYSGVKLDFEHQLSRIELKAWGNPDSYDIEIAGVRIGSMVVESDFNFAATPANFENGDITLSGGWLGTQKKDCVEYIFRPGDEVISIGNGNHETEATSISIMGNGGMAMVIPTDDDKWNHTADPSNADQGRYFSVLLRVKETSTANHTLLYPYVDASDLSSSVSADGMNTIYLSIDKQTGKVRERVYWNKEDNGYYTDPEFSTKYTVAESEEIRNYGWAAVPYATIWKPGNQYTCILDYSKGVGVHDPADPHPGQAIISPILVGVTENWETWPTVDDFTVGGDDDVTDNITID